MTKFELKLILTSGLWCRSIPRGTMHYTHCWQLFLNFQLLDIFYNYSFYFDCVASSQLSVRKEEAGSKFVSNKVPCTQLRHA